MIGLTATQRVIVTIKGRPHRGVILEVYFRSYKIKLDSGETDRFSASKVRPDNARRPTAPLLPSAAEVAALNSQALVSVTAYESRRPIPKPDLPELCPAWLAFVRKQPCCNCGHPVSEAHHEGKKDAFAQKVRDTLALPLCKICHFVYTQKNRLPLYAGARVFGDDNLLTREDSLRILHAEQERLLHLALAQLEVTERIEILSQGLAKLRPGSLAPLLGRIDEAA